MKTTFTAKRRRPSWPNGDDLRGQMKTTFKAKRRRPSRPNEDDLQGQTKTTFRAKRRRPSGPIEDDLRRASDAVLLPTHEVGPGSGLYPRSSTLVHDTSLTTGPSGPPPHQIMTTGTPLDPVVICLGL